MHRTLKLETASPPRSTLDAQQAAFDCFRYTYNHERPHEALGQRTPASVYTPSPRPMPSHLGEPEYPEELDLRRVAPNGCVCLRYSAVRLSDLLVGETIGVEMVDDGKWQLWFGPIFLGLVIQQSKGSKATIVKNLPIGETRSMPQ